MRTSTNQEAVCGIASAAVRAEGLREVVLSGQQRGVAAFVEEGAQCFNAPSGAAAFSRNSHAHDGVPSVDHEGDLVRAVGHGFKNGAEGGTRCAAVACDGPILVVEREAVTWTPAAR